MNNKIPLHSGLITCALASMVIYLWGTNSAPTQTPPPFFEIEHPVGAYMVDLREVTSVSIHRYFVDGTIRVDELTIDTKGRTVARFYVAERNRDLTTPRGVGQSAVERVQDKVDEIKDRLGGPAALLDRTVIKSYPTSTHAHTVEYRVASVEDLQELYKKLSTHWTSLRQGSHKLE